MIRRIQALNYRCLRYVDVALDRFHVLVGPNASGKSTLFDAVAFLGDLVSDGLEVAVDRRTGNFRDLAWKHGRRFRKGAAGFELAVEFDVPEDIRGRLPAVSGFSVFRYEVAIEECKGELRIASERGILMPRSLQETVSQPTLFPDPPSPPATILQGGHKKGSRTVLSKSREGRDNFNIEVSPRPGRGWALSITFGAQRSALGNLPESPETFPMATYVKQTLERRVKPLFLDSLRMRLASPPASRSGGFAPDGSNLPWAIKHMRKKHRRQYDEWLEHVKTVLSDLDAIRIMERPDDRHAYPILRYRTGAEVPSWMASDGTLRLLALTLLAYLPNEGEIYVLEEPENGIHPMAMECVYQSLSSIYDSQLLLATHSSVVLKLAEPEDVLCFAKNPEGATDIVQGDRHPLLAGWQGGAPDMELLFAMGVLG